jgi:hypothetical protein
VSVTCSLCSALAVGFWSEPDDQYGIPYCAVHQDEISGTLAGELPTPGSTTQGDPDGSQDDREVQPGG